jgi:penicillin-binding protein 1A
MVDGGFAMGSDLPLFAAGETEADLVDTVTTSDGQQKAVPKKANFGTLSSGGLY